MKHGLTELTPDEFKTAITFLDLPWADDKSKLDLVHECLDKDTDFDQRGTLSLTEIAVGIIDCVPSNIIDFENKFLEITFKSLQKRNKISQIKDMINYLNFSRDYTCTGLEFLAMFR